MQAESVTGHGIAPVAIDRSSVGHAVGARDGVRPDGRFARDKLLPAFERLRLARPCATLRHRPPDAWLGGGAVLVYRLGDGQVGHAITVAPPDLVTGEPPIPRGRASMPGPPPFP